MRLASSKGKKSAIPLEKRNFVGLNKFNQGHGWSLLDHGYGEGRFRGQLVQNKNLDPREQGQKSLQLKQKNPNPEIQRKPNAK